MFTLTPTVDPSPFTRFVDRVAQGMTSSQTFSRGLAATGLAYLEEQRARFRAMAQGGGEWPELADFTKAERRRLGFPAARPILIRLGVLANALRKGAPGNLFVIDAKGLTIGFGGPARHPGYEPGDNPPTIAEIAYMQHNGLGRLPVRRLLVAPSGHVIRAGQRELSDDLSKLYAQSRAA